MSTEIKLGILVGVLIITVGAFYFSSRNGTESEVPEITIPQNPPPVTVTKKPQATKLPQTPIEPTKLTEKKPEPVSPLTPKQLPGKIEITKPIISKPPIAEPLTPPKSEIQKPRYHKVVKGDTLYNIAEAYYGNGRFSKIIFKANQKIMKNPDTLKVGWKLRIPYRQEILEKK